MSKVSVIIPCRSETLEVEPGVSVLERTVRDVHEKAAGEIEIVVVFDGPPYQHVPPYVIPIHAPWGGTKVAINLAAQAASGEYLFKLDGHCSVGEGFDEILQADMEENWIVTPRFYVLDPLKWDWQDDRFYDYFRLPCPFTYKRGVMFQAGGHWPERNEPRKDFTLDENMKLHGSCFFVSRDFYWNALGGLDPKNGAGSWNGEDIELSLKTWLGPWGGGLMVNKHTWYAHMHRGGQRPREWGFSYHEAYASAFWTARYWLNNQWPERAHDFEWLVDRFWPIPGWPENWKETYAEWKSSNA